MAGTRARSCAPWTTKRPARDRPQSDQAFLDPVARRDAAPRPACSPSCRRRRARPSRAVRPAPGCLRKCMSTCQRLVRPLEGRADDLGRVEALGQEIGDAARRRSRRRRAARRSSAPLAGRICFGRWSQRFMHSAGGNLPQELSTGYTQAYRTGLHRASSPAIPTFSTERIAAQGVAWTTINPPAPKLSRAGASPATRAAGTISPRSSIPAARSRCRGFAGPIRSSSRTAGAISAAAARPSTCSGRRASR